MTTKEKVSVKRNGKTVKVTKKVSKQVPEPLLMPTSMIAQNGATLTQNTKVAVTGCTKPKPKAKTAGKKKGRNRYGYAR